MIKTLKILSINIRSLWPKIEELKNYCYKNDIDIINVQESWIGSDKPTPIIPSYNTITNTNERSKGAGLVTFINSKIKFKMIKKLDNINGIEGIFFKIYTDDGNMTIGNIYIHPGYNNSKMEKFHKTY